MSSTTVNKPQPWFGVYPEGGKVDELPVAFFVEEGDARQFAQARWPGIAEVQPAVEWGTQKRWSQWYVTVTGRSNKEKAPHTGEDDAADAPLTHVFKGTNVHPEHHGQPCRVLKSYADMKCLVEFEDGDRIKVFRMLLRKLGDTEPPLPQPKPKYLPEFSKYRSAIPAFDQPGIDLDTVYRNTKSNNPVSRTQLYNFLQAWMAEGLVVATPATKPGETITYRLPPATETPSIIEIDEPLPLEEP